MNFASIETTGPFFTRKENSDKQSGSNVPMVCCIYLSHTTMRSKKVGIQGTA